MFDTNHILHTALITTLSSAGACASGSAQPTTAPEPTPAPEPTAAPGSTATPEPLRDGEHQKLARFVGEWTGTGTLQTGETTAPVTSAFSCEVAPGGVAVACVHRADIEGMGPLTENALIGIDPADGKLHWYNINTMGETHDHVGQWVTAEQIAWTFEGQAEGQPLVESITMDLGGDTLSFHSETTVGGQQAALFRGRLARSAG